MGAPAIDPVLSDLMISQIASLIWWIKETNSNPNNPISSLGMGQSGRKKVVVGLGLKKATSASASAVSPEDDDEVFDLNAEEKRRFEGIMELVAGWTG